MLQNDQFTNLAKLEQKEFDKVISELKSKNTRGATALAESLECTHKLLNQ
ncbi:hypothetical protein G3M81_22810 [Bacillus paralicheniformis]|nr:MULTISPECIES: hypothetical protein [Bacillus]QII26924.1 hypothetical protein G3M80_20720 [Bacillus altitudinis]QII51392.1 hypothetical protein G3M81_22810 [Bacillus paralicheniformis]